MLSVLRLAVSGATGRMGQEILKQISNDERFEVSFELSRNSGDLKTWQADKIDAVVDFSLPDSFEDVFKWCSANKKPLVSGTTGFETNAFEDRGFTFAFMHSGNFSIGIAALNRSLQNFKGMGSDMKIWVEDVHHIHKLDAPSGTAVKIEKEIKDKIGALKVPIESVREGDVFGIHRVHIETSNEKIVLEHEALNRGVFARGALNALEWLAGQKPGLYKFEDHLNF